MSHSRPDMPALPPHTRLARCEPIVMRRTDYEALPEFARFEYAGRQWLLLSARSGEAPPPGAALEICEVIFSRGEQAD